MCTAKLGLVSGRQAHEGGKLIRAFSNPVTLVTPTVAGFTPSLSARRHRRPQSVERRHNMVDILHRVGIKAPVGEVYKALATREGLAGWWTTDTHGESKVGGTIKFSFTKDGTLLGGFDMKVLEL